jgi:hypothetical protein
MTIYELLARTQRIFVAWVFIAWLAGFVAMLSLRPQLAILGMVLSVAALLMAFVYLLQSARCPRCAARLWLSLHKLVPIGRRPRMQECPSCGISVSESTEA